MYSACIPSASVRPFVGQALPVISKGLALRGALVRAVRGDLEAIDSHKGSALADSSQGLRSRRQFTTRRMEAIAT